VPFTSNPLCCTDGNTWVHWCLSAHGGNVVDKNDKVIINSPETEKALDYAKQLYDNMIPGVASWNDASNNKAFLTPLCIPFIFSTVLLPSAIGTAIQVPEHR
jgi:ABC-type glycerol-3-phosphate transport system substrate-binding protein